MLQVLLAVALSAIMAGASSANAPAIHSSYFKPSLSKLLYFKNPAAILGLSRDDGTVFRSSDYGGHWSSVSHIPTGKATRIYAHPHEPKTAFALSSDTDHWITRDEGKSWQLFKTPLPPTSSGERPLVFHVERSGWVMFIGEKCIEDKGGWWPFPREVCHNEAFYVKDGFAKAVKEGAGAVTSLLDEGTPIAKCLWSRHTKEFDTMAEEAIFCLEIVTAAAAASASSTPTTNGYKNRRHYLSRRDIADPQLNSRSNNHTLRASAARHHSLQLVVSEDFFKTQRIIHFGAGNDGNSGDQAGGGIVSFSIVKSYVLVALSHAHSSEMDLFISMDGHTWAESHLPLPPGAEEDAYTVLESTKHSVLIDVVISNARAAGSLFRSNSNGTYYTQSLEHTHRSKDGLVDVERVHGLEGVIIANQVSNWDEIGRGGGGIFHREHINLRTRITFDDGANWRFMRAPDRDIKGKRYGCSEDGWKTGECALHVHSVTSTRKPGRIFGSPSSAGVIMAVGSVGSKLQKWRECDTFMSRDGGISWTMAHKEAHHVQMADSGSVLVLVNDESPVDTINYSLNGGNSWQQLTLKDKIRFSSLLVDDDGLSPVVLAIGSVRGGEHNHEQAILALDFSKSWKRQCKVDPQDPRPNSDMESFVLRAHENTDCVMGHKSQYIRRKTNAQCHLNLDRVLVPLQQDCPCSDSDFECDYNYAWDAKARKCELVGDVVVPKGQCLHESDHFMASSGYRLIPGDTCLRDKGKELDKPVRAPCPRHRTPGGGGDGKGDNSGSHGPVTHHTTIVDGEAFVMSFANSTSYLLMTTKQEIYRTDDEGATWSAINLAKATGKSNVGNPVYLAEHTHNDQRAFAYTDNDILVYTGDRAKTWHVVNNLPGPANGLHIRPLIDFSPDNPDWLLYIGGTACPDCHTEIWVSPDNGKKWNRITTHATNCRFATNAKDKHQPRVVCTNYKNTSGKDNEQDRQRHHRSSGNYVEVRVFDDPFSSDSTYKVIPLPNPSHSEVVGFHIYTRFIVIAVVESKLDESGSTRSSLKLYVSEDGSTAHEARFPPGTNIKPEGFTLLPSHNGNILLDVEGAPNTEDQHWGVGWGTLFSSNSNGTHFHQVLQHTNRNHHGMVDIERVNGIEGMMVANRVANADALGKPGVHKQIRTVASWDDGWSWHPLNPPSQDVNGKDIDCPDCTLNLYSRSAMVVAGLRYGAKSAPGYLVGVGSVGAHLGRYMKAKTYLSRDAGITWNEVRDTESQFEFGDHGSLVVLVDDHAPTNSLRYSYDAGHSWNTYSFTSGNQRVVVDRVTNGLTGSGQHVLIQAREIPSSSGSDRGASGKSMIISVDFTRIHPRQCQLNTRDHDKGDFELWAPHWGIDASGKNVPICVSGQKTQYWRRKPLANCFVGREFDVPETVSYACDCTVRDFECDEGFWLNDYGECTLDGPDPYQPVNCREGTTYMGRSGYKKISHSKCVDGRQLDKPVERVCGRSGGMHATAHVEHSPIAEVQYFKNSHHILARTEDDKVLVSFDEGGKWDPLSLPESKQQQQQQQKVDAPDRFVSIVEQPYFEDYAYFIPAKGTVALYTDDEARTTRMLHLPTSPAHSYQPPLRFHPEYSDWLIFLGQPNESCKTPDGGNCQVEAFVTLDHGAHWDALIAPVGSGGCSFLRTDRLTKAHRNDIVCSRHPAAREGGGNIEVSRNWFKKNEHVLVKHATDFAIMGEFLIISQDYHQGKALQMHVSLDGETAAIAKFPGDKDITDPAYTVLEPPEGFNYHDRKGNNHKMPGGGLSMHVTKSDHPGAEWGTIYTSNSNGTYYRRTLEMVNRDETGLVDFERIRALEGVAIANVVANSQDVLKKNKPKRLQSMITVDGGARWHYLHAVYTPNDHLPCQQTAPKSGECALHLHGYTEITDPENIYSAAGAVGLIMGVGNVGPHLNRIGECDTYLSSNGGVTWRKVRNGPMWHEFGDHGALIVVADRLHPITQIEYSLDRGKSWQSLKLPKEAHSMRVESLTTTPDSTSRRFMLYGKRDNKNEGIIVGLDFSGVQPRMCKFSPVSNDGKNLSDQDDFELYSPQPIDVQDESKCILGREVQYYRRKPDRECYVGEEFRPVRYISETCECTERDYECNYNFVRAHDDPHGKCVLVKGMQAPRTNCTKDHKEYFTIEAPYRRIPQSICVKGIVLDRPKEVWCPGKAQAMAIFWSIFLPVLFLGLAYVGYKKWRSRYPYFRLEDIGSTVMAAPGISRRFLENRSFNRAGNGALQQLEPVFVGAVNTARAVGNATKEGLLWGLDRIAPYMPNAIQRWSYEHPPRWGAMLSMDGRSRHSIRGGTGGSRFAYHPVRTSEAAGQLFGEYESEDVDEYDEFETGFNHFLEEENLDPEDAQPLDREVLFANPDAFEDNDG